MIRALLFALLLAVAPWAQAANGLRFEVSYPASLEQGPLDGRVLLVVAKTNELVGKLHFYVGDTATYYLEEAAFLLQRFLEATKEPYYAGSFDVGRREPHCYSGTPEFPGQTSHQRVLPRMLERIVRTAPPAADLVSWRY